MVITALILGRHMADRKSRQLWWRGEGETEEYRNGTGMRTIIVTSGDKTLVFCRERDVIDMITQPVINPWLGVI